MVGRTGGNNPAGHRFAMSIARRGFATAGPFRASHVASPALKRRSISKYMVWPGCMRRDPSTETGVEVDGLELVSRSPCAIVALLDDDDDDDNKLDSLPLCKSLSTRNTCLVNSRDADLARRRCGSAMGGESIL